MLIFQGLGSKLFHYPVTMNIIHVWRVFSNQTKTQQLSLVSPSSGSFNTFSNCGLICITKMPHNLKLLPSIQNESPVKIECLSQWPSPTVDRRNPTNQLRLVVYPTIYKVLYIPGGAGFLPSTVVPKRVILNLKNQGKEYKMNETIFSRFTRFQR